MSFLACCVPGCSSRFSDGPPLHRFPNPGKDPQRIYSWVMNIGGDIVTLSNNFIFRNRRVCHKHFPEIWHYTKNHLCPLVIPTLHLKDLKAFERRLTEVIACLQPATMRWRILLAVVSVCTAIAAWHWLTDPLTPVVSLTQSLWNHPFFAFTSTFLVLLFMMGVHRKVIAPSIITARTRSVLNDFNMSCDETGKLILKPRPANT